MESQGIFWFLGWITRTPRYAPVGTISWTRDSSPTCRCANRDVKAGSQEEGQSVGIFQGHQ